MLGLVDSDPVQVVRRLSERRRPEAHIAEHFRTFLIPRVENVSEIPAVLAEIEPLVDQLKRGSHLLGRKIPRVLENPEDAAAIGRDHRPDCPVHRRPRYLLRSRGLRSRGGSGRNASRFPPPAPPFPLISAATFPKLQARLPSPLR